MEFPLVTPPLQKLFLYGKGSNNVKVGTHALFDDANFTVGIIKAPLAAQALQRLG